MSVPNALPMQGFNGLLQGGPRFTDPAAKMRAGLPGPGQYAVPGGVGRQPVSTRPSTPSVGFPKAHRDASRKVSTWRIGPCITAHKFSLSK